MVNSLRFFVLADGSYYPEDEVVESVLHRDGAWLALDGDPSDDEIADACERFANGIREDELACDVTVDAAALREDRAARARWLDDMERRQAEER